MQEKVKGEPGSEFEYIGTRPLRPDGVDNFTSPGRPIATISNVMLEYRPGPPPKKKAPTKKPETKKP